MKLSLLVFIFLLVASVGSTWRTASKNIESRERIEDLREQVRRLEEKNMALKNETLDKESSEYLEREARERLNMIMPGETLIVLPQELPATQEPEQDEEAQQRLATRRYYESLPNWRRWWEYFFGNGVVEG